MGLFSKKIHHHGAGQVDKSRLPRHIAIIMDGNGRWAKQRGLPRTAGHKVGAETFRKIATYCKDLGVEYLTVYAFSTENWKRPADEVGGHHGPSEAISAGGHRHYGARSDPLALSGGPVRHLTGASGPGPDRTNEISSHIHGFQANVCLNYGGRDEILHAARRFAQDCTPGRGRPGGPYRGGLFLLSLLRRDSGPGAHHPHQRRGAPVRLSAVAVRLFGVLLLRYPVAGLRRAGPWTKAIIAYQSRDRRFGGVK